MTLKNEYEYFIRSALEYSKKFFIYFGYYCELPYDEIKVGGRSALDEFKAVVDKSIANSFDYTIEKYRTTPMEKGNYNDLLID